MDEGLGSVFVKTLMGSNMYIRVTSCEINCNTRVTMDNSFSVLFAYAFASGLDTSRARTRRMLFLFYFSFHRFTSAHCPPLNFSGSYIGGTSQRTKTFYQEGRCMLLGGFEPSIWWVWTGYKGWWGQGYFGNDLCLKRHVQHMWPNFHLNWRVSGWMVFIATRWQIRRLI
jgi:hypothetical protein